MELQYTIDGIWTLVKTDSFHEQVAYTDVILELREGRFSLYAGDYLLSRGKVNIDTTTYPFKIQFVTYLDEEPVEGILNAIFKVENGSLLLCRSKLNSPPPDGFEGRITPEWVLETFEQSQ